MVAVKRRLSAAAPALVIIARHHLHPAMPLVESENANMILVRLAVELPRKVAVRPSNAHPDLPVRLALLAHPARPVHQEHLVLVHPDLKDHPEVCFEFLNDHVILDPGTDGAPGHPGAPGAPGEDGAPGDGGGCDHCPPPRTAPGY